MSQFAGLDEEESCARPDSRGRLSPHEHLRKRRHYLPAIGLRGLAGIVYNRRFVHPGWEIPALGTKRTLEQANHKPDASPRVPPTVYWRVEGSLLDLTVVQPVAFFTWNAQTFSERFRRRGLILLMAALRPFLYSTNRKFATRVVHTVLRGVTRDRLDLLGEEYFQYRLKPELKTHGAERVRELVRAGADVVLVSQGLEHVMKPLAQHLGVKRVVANRLEFRDGLATGRLLEPVIRPRGAFARIR